MRRPNSDLTPLNRRFVDLTLRRAYEDDNGGRQPKRRAELVDLMTRIWHNGLSEGQAIDGLTVLLYELFDQQPVYTHEDVLVIEQLCRLYYSEHMSALGVAGGLGRWNMTRILQSDELRIRYRLADPHPTLLPISEVHR